MALPTEYMLLDGCSLSTDDLLQLGKNMYKIKVLLYTLCIKRCHCVILSKSSGKIINHVFVLQLTKDSEDKVSKSRALIDDIVKESKVVYGITTGFGKFARTVIEKKKLE